MAPMPRPSTRSLTEGAIAPTLLVFALPILGSNVLQSLNGSVNAVWVGRFLGEEALVATANSNNILFFLLGSVFGIGMAATILVAQAIGAHDPARARKVIGTSATFFGGLALLVALAGLPLSRHILAWMGTPEDSLPLAEAYLRIIFLAVPFLYMFSFATAVLRGAGDTRTPFVFLGLVVVIDIIVNPLLIFGIGPFPRMGIAGSATATLVANACSLAAMLAWLRWRRHPLWIPRAERRAYLPDPAIVRALVVKGVPTGLQMILVSLAVLGRVSLVSAYGVDTASAYRASLQLWTSVQMPALAVGAACTPLAAQNVGAGRWPRVEGTMRAGVAFNFILTGALIAPLLLFGPRILSLFLPPGSPSIEAGQHINLIVIWSFLFFGVTFVVSGVVRSTGAVVPPLLILVFALWGVRVPFASLLQPALGADAIWLSFPVSALVAMVLSLAYYRWGRWREARMMAGDPREVALAAEVPAQPPAPVADCCPEPGPEPVVEPARAGA